MEKKNESNKDVYVVPVVEIVEVKIERGFQTSGEEPASPGEKPRGTEDYTW